MVNRPHHTTKWGGKRYVTTHTSKWGGKRYVTCQNGEAKGMSHVKIPGNITPDIKLIEDWDTNHKDIDNKHMLNLCYGSKKYQWAYSLNAINVDRRIMEGGVDSCLVDLQKILTWEYNILNIYPYLGRWRRLVVYHNHLYYFSDDSEIASRLIVGYSPP